MKLFFADLETTGTDPLKHGISQMAFHIFVDDKPAVRLVTPVRPIKGQLVSPEALEITGITMDQLRTYPESPEIFKWLKEHLAKYVDKYSRADKFLWIGYNAMFDVSFMRNFFERHNDSYFGSWWHFPPIDVMHLAAFVLARQRHLLPNFKLKTVCDHFSIPLEDAHTADADVTATRLLFERFVHDGLTMLPELDTLNVGETSKKLAA